MPEGEIFDVRPLARVGPNANFQIRKLFRKGVAPGLCVADTLVEIDKEQRHFLSVGWVEWSETHHSWAATEGFAGLNPPCVLISGLRARLVQIRHVAGRSDVTQS